MHANLLHLFIIIVGSSFNRHLGTRDEVDHQRPEIRSTEAPQREEAGFQRLQNTASEGGEGDDWWRSI